MSNYMPEPPPMDYDNWMPPPPDEPYFMPDDPFPDDLFSGAPPDYDYVPVDDPWLPDDERFVPEDVGHLPDIPPLAQDGLQGFEQPEPPDAAVDPLIQTAIELGGVVVEPEVAAPQIEDGSAFQALNAIGIEAENFDPTQDPPPFYDAETGTAYWIGVFQPDKEDRENCVTSILSLGRNPETGAMEAQLAPCVPGEWDKAYASAEYLIQVAQKGGIDRCFDAAEGMALATDQRELWENERGVALEPEAAKEIADYTRDAWEVEL